MSLTIIYIELLIIIFIFIVYDLHVFYQDDIFEIHPVFSLEQNNTNNNNNKTPIENVVVISQGRRSFDNYFGTYPGANGFPSNISVPLNPFQNVISFQKFAISFSFRVNTSAVGEDGFMINRGGVGKETPGDNLNFGVWIDKAKKLNAGFETKKGDDLFIRSSNNYADGYWHKLLVTYDGNILNLYVDKKEVAKKLTNGSIPDTNKSPFIRLGSNFLKPGNFYKGDLDNLTIWNRSLDQKEISSIIDDAKYPNDSLVSITYNSSISKKNYTDYLKFNGNNNLDIPLTSIKSQTDHVKPFHLKEIKTPVLKYGPTVYTTSYNSGLMDGFIYAQTANDFKDNSSIIMGYYDNTDIELYWYLASKFVLADNFFSPSRLDDLSNNLYLYSADPGIYKKSVPKEGLNAINSTIFDLLEKNNISWKIYVADYNPQLNYTNSSDISKRHLIMNPILGIPRFVDNKTLNSKIVDLSEYLYDLKNKLPQVSYIVLPDGQESSSKNLLAGEEYVTSLIVNLMKSKYWNNSVFILTYSGTGGWYDHIAPPKDIPFELGFRVPTLIVSPYAKEGFVDSTFYDSTSILKFIEYNNNLPSLTSRDALSNNLLNAFDFNTPLQNRDDVMTGLLEKYNSRLDTLNNSFKLKNTTFTLTIYSTVIITILIMLLISWIFFAKKLTS